MKYNTIIHNWVLRFMLVTIIMVPLGLLGQAKADSLRRTIMAMPNNTAKIDNLLSLQEELKYEEPTVSAEFLQKALVLSEDLGYERGKLKSLLAKGDLDYTQSKFESALKSYKEAGSLAQTLRARTLLVEALCKQGNALNDLRSLNAADSIISAALRIAMEAPLDSSSVSLCYKNLGNLAFANNQYDKALDFYQNTLAYNSGNDRTEAVINLNIGLIHFSQGDFDKAESYYIIGLKSAEKINELKLVAEIHKYLGMAKRGLKDYEEARKYNHLALDHYERVNDPSNMAHVHTNLSNIHKDLANYPQAISELEKCLKLLSQVNYPLGECYTLKNLGELHLKLGAFKKAKEFFLLAKKRSEDADILIVNTDATRLLSQVYDSLGDYKTAYKHHLSYKVLADSLVEQTNKSRMAELEEKYQNGQKQQEIEMLMAENEIASLEFQKQENFKNYLIFTALLLVLLIGVIYSRYQIKARANARLTELDRIKSNFFTNISHEFRTPLTLILGPAQKLLRRKNDDLAKKELSIIHQNASRLNELINQLMDLSKLEVGKLTLAISENNLKKLLQISAASFESHAETSQIDFQVEIDNAPIHAFFDEDKILKILNNLLSNAFRFTPKGGKVILKAEVKNSNAFISVADTGPGISKAEQALVFQRFQQGQTKHNNTTGTGVGLTLSKELARLHKGDIELKSTMGEGARFTVHFPISRNAYPASALVDSQVINEVHLELGSMPVEVTDDACDEHQQIILLVEDNADLRQYMNSLLKESFTVKEAVDGKEGIRLAEEIVPDLIISDLMMPQADGIELSNILKENVKTSHIPIILLTAKADRETRIDGLKTGADDFLTKPFDNEELMIRVNNLLEQRKKLQEKFAKQITLSPSKLQAESPNEKFVRKALEIVDYHLSNSDFTVEQFQEEMAMSRMQLHRKLKALTGFSASEFIRDIRLQRAADLFGQNGINITEVAYRSGFNSPSYFTQCFKEKYGISPSKYLSKSSGTTG